MSSGFNAFIGLAGILAMLGLTGFLLEKRRRRTHPVSPGYQADLVVAFEEPFELYHNALSLCSMKTRFCLAELGIDYKSHPIDLIETGCYENIRPRLLGINPAGTVPVLVHEGHPVYESHEQIRYAARFSTTDAPSLVPQDEAMRAEMERWVDLSSLTEDPVEHGDESAGNAVPGQTVPLFCTMIEKISVFRIIEGLLFHFDRFRPFLFLVLKAGGIRNLPKMAPAARAIARSRNQLRVHLQALEVKLEESGGPYILGEAFSLADVSWLAIFERLRQVDAEGVFLGGAERVRCAAYWARLQSRPAYAEAIEGHSHPLIDYGRRRIAEAKAADESVRRCLEG